MDLTLVRRLPNTRRGSVTNSLIIVLTYLTIIDQRGRNLLTLIPIRALRQRHCVGGGGAPPTKEIGGGGSAKFLTSPTCFKSVSAKNFCYQGMHVEQLFFAVFCPQIR